MGYNIHTVSDGQVKQLCNRRVHNSRESRPHLVRKTFIPCFLVFALAFTSFAFGKAYWTSTDLSKASASIATLTDSAVASHSTGTLPDSVWGPAWSAQNPESLARG